MYKQEKFYLSKNCGDSVDTIYLNNNIKITTLTI